MKIIVCIKQILDPELPAARFKIDPEAGKAVPPPGGQSFVINPFDEQAVEAALKIKDSLGAEVTALSLGDASGKDVLKHAMAMGADNGVLVNVPDLEDYDSYQTALVLSKAIDKLKEYDLIFCGRQAGDWDNGQVGIGIAEFLGIPCITPAQKVELTDDGVKVERVIPDGFDVHELPRPCLIAVSSEFGLPRYTTMKGILAAGKKEVTFWSDQDLELDRDDELNARTKLVELFIPKRETTCHFIEGEDPEEAAVNLALKLRNDKVI